MKTTLAVLVAGLVGFAGTVGAAAQDKEKAAPKIEGTYKIVGGAKDGVAIGEDAKKEGVVVDAKTFRIGEKGKGFMMSYKLDPSATPTKIDMVIEETPDSFKDAKGAKGYGIVAAGKGGTLKLAYSLDKDKRPTKFGGKDGFYFEMKKAEK